MKDFEFDFVNNLANEEGSLSFQLPDIQCKVTKITRYITTVIANENLINEDWKTAISKNQGWIPKGTELQVQIFKNLYGRFFKTKYNDSVYYINYNEVSLKSIIEKNIIEYEYLDGTKNIEETEREISIKEK